VNEPRRHMENDKRGKRDRENNMRGMRRAKARDVWS
jgi:hypothetical protein